MLVVFIFERINESAFDKSALDGFTAHYFTLVSAIAYFRTLLRHVSVSSKIKAKAVPLHATEALEGRGSIAPTHSRPRR
jgi:hypothetical protein